MSNNSSFIAVGAAASSGKIEQLQREVKDLQFELEQKNEAMGMKIETIRSLQD